MSNDIFVRQDEIPQNNGKLSKKDIMSSIPKDSVTKCDLELSKSQTEWRWRIFKFPNKKNEVIEISYKKPNEDRMYINKSGEWVPANVDDFFYKFMIKEYYSYSD